MIVSPIPGSIVRAICAVQATLDSVKKGQRNTHGGYMFASADDIYAALTRKMGEAGLVCMGLEDNEPEIKAVEKDGKTSQWMKVAYFFVLATEDATWTDPKSRRTLYIQVTGPQTFQAAQSYAEKSFLRSLFKIPTGDMDLDSLPENYEYAPIPFKSRSNGMAASATIAPPPAPEEAAQASPEAETPKAQIHGDVFLADLDVSLSRCASEDSLHEVWADNLETICSFGQERRMKAEGIFERHQARIGKAA